MWGRHIDVGFFYEINNDGKAPSWAFHFHAHFSSRPAVDLLHVDGRAQSWALDREHDTEFRAAGSDDSCRGLRAASAQGGCGKNHPSTLWIFRKVLQALPWTRIWDISNKNVETSCNCKLDMCLCQYEEYLSRAPAIFLT